MKFNKHLLLLTPGFPVDEDDSTCIPPLQAFVKRFRETHPEGRLSVIALQYPYSKKKYEWHGIPVFACGGHNRSFPWRLETWRQAWAFFKKIHDRHPVDIIHSFWLSECALLGRIFSQRYGCRHFTTLMGQDVRPDNRYLKWLPLKKMTFVAVSDFQKQTFESHSRAPVSAVIPWGLDCSAFPKPDADRAIDLLGVGALTPLKRYHLFLEIAQEVKARHPQLRCCLIGDGPERPRLEQLARSLGLTHHVTFAGQLPREKVLQHMTRAKILLHPSRYESQGYVFLEALAAGAQVVSLPTGLAQPSAKWRTGSTAGHLVENILAILEAPKDFKPLLFLR